MNAFNRNYIIFELALCCVLPILNIDIVIVSQNWTESRWDRFCQIEAFILSRNTTGNKRDPLFCCVYFWRQLPSVSAIEQKSELRGFEHVVALLEGPFDLTTFCYFLSSYFNQLF